MTSVLGAVYISSIMSIFDSLFFKILNTTIDTSLSPFGLVFTYSHQSLLTRTWTGHIYYQVCTIDWFYLLFLWEYFLIILSSCILAKTCLWYTHNCEGIVFWSGGSWPHEGLKSKSKSNGVLLPPPSSALWSWSQAH